MTAVIVPFGFTKMAAAADTTTAERSDGVSTATSLESVPRNVRIAQELCRNEHRVYASDLMDLSAESCGLCGGFFPPTGEVRFFWADTEHPTYLHVGCLVQAGDWAGVGTCACTCHTGVSMHGPRPDSICCQRWNEGLE